MVIVFSPCKYQQFAFLDGGILDNTPVYEVKKQGADKTLAVIFEIVLCLMLKFVPDFSVYGTYIASSSQMWGVVANIVIKIISINIGLGIFNLIPLPPLDGSKILSGFLPYNAKNWMDSHGQIFEIIFVALWIVGILSLIISPIISIVDNALTNLFMSIFGLI